MDVVALLPVVLKIAVAGMIMALGMGAGLTEAAYLWRRPRLLLRSMLAIYVVVPALAVVGAAVLPLPTGFKIALLVLAASGGAPLLPRKLMALGNRGYVFSLVVTSSFAAIVAVPVWLHVLTPFFHHERVLTSVEVARVVGASFLLPLTVGVALAWLAPVRARRWSERLLGAFGLVLVGTALTVLIVHWDVLRGAGWLALATLVLFSGVALAVGHVLGGPAPADRTALAVTCATRHVGVAAVLAAAVPGPRALVLLLAYVVAATIVALPYLYWRQRSAAGGRAPAYPLR